MTQISLLVVDDHALIREGLITTVQQQWQEVEPIWEARSLEEGLQLFALHHPDIVVLDIDFKTERNPDQKEPLRDGIAAIAHFKHLDPMVCMIILTQFKGYSIERARRAGANGYLLKDWRYGQVIAQIQDIFRGHPFFPPYSNRLTSREYQALDLMSQGLTDKEIAIELGIAFVTVRDYIKHIFAEFDVHNRQEALVHARDHNILP